MDETPKNEYEVRKFEKDNQIRKTQTRKKLRKYLIWLIGLLIVGGLIILLVKSVNKTDLKTSQPGQFYEAQSREHITTGASHPAYNSNPPTGGWHYDKPAQTGIYDKELPDEQLVHNLEHGHIWIAYKPDIPQDQIKALAAIAKSYGSRIIMTPRAANDSPIALAAWQYLLKLDSVDEKQIKEFIDAYRNIAGPEKNIPDSGFKDFRENK